MNYGLLSTDSTTDWPQNRQKGAERSEKRRTVPHEREAKDTKGRMLLQVWLLLAKETDV